MAAWSMFARLEFNLCHGSQTSLVLYRNKRDAESPDYAALHLLRFSLSNEQLTELVIVAKVKPVDMNK